jgi:hypothetical protein
MSMISRQVLARDAGFFLPAAAALASLWAVIKTKFNL